MKHVLRVASVAVALAAFAQELPPLPERFAGTLMVMAGRPTGVARIAVTIEKWTTDEERKRMLTALEQKQTDGLVREMEEHNVGYIQIDEKLRYPIRTAATWMSPKGRMVRVATARPISFAEDMTGFRSLDYTIGVVEFVLPSDGSPGEGTLLAATQILFNEEGRLEVKSMPQSVAPQKVTNLVAEPAKPKKEKKDEKKN
jgi:hypothetical protein